MLHNSSIYKGLLSPNAVLPNRQQDCLYHAILAMTLLGNFLTRNFLASSNSSKPIPKPKGRNQYSTGTIAVPRTLWNLGTYRKNMAMTIAKMMAGKRYGFLQGAWLRSDKRRVRTLIRLNHCLEES